MVTTHAVASTFPAAVFAKPAKSAKIAKPIQFASYGNALYAAVMARKVALMRASLKAEGGAKSVTAWARRFEAALSASKRATAAREKFVIELSASAIARPAIFIAGRGFEDRETLMEYHDELIEFQRNIGTTVFVGIENNRAARVAELAEKTSAALARHKASGYFDAEVEVRALARHVHAMAAYAMATAPGNKNDCLAALAFLQRLSQLHNRGLVGLNIHQLPKFAAAIAARLAGLR